MTRSFLLAVACIAAVNLAGADVAPAPIRVSASKLVETYQLNEALADELYTGKSVEVTGKLLRVRRSKYTSKGATQPDYLVEMLSEDGKSLNWPIHFVLSGEHRRRLSELKPRQPITVVGKCIGRGVWSAPPGSGKDDYSEIHFHNCALVGKE